MSIACGSTLAVIQLLGNDISIVSCIPKHVVSVLESLLLKNATPNNIIMCGIIYVFLYTFIPLAVAIE